MMGVVKNGEVVKQFTDLVKGQCNVEIPQIGFSTNAVPTIDINPKYSVFAYSASVTAAGSSTLFTSSTERDTYITGLTFSIIKDSANDSATGSTGIYTTINGNTAVYIARIAILTLTAQNETISIQFTYPLKIDRGAIVAIALVTIGAGAFTRCATVQGFVI